MSAFTVSDLAKMFEKTTFFAALRAMDVSFGYDGPHDFKSYCAHLSSDDCFGSMFDPSILCDTIVEACNNNSAPVIREIIENNTSVVFDPVAETSSKPRAHQRASLLDDNEEYYQYVDEDGEVSIQTRKKSIPSPFVANKLEEPDVSDSAQEDHCSSRSAVAAKSRKGYSLKQSALEDQGSPPSARSREDLSRIEPSKTSGKAERTRSNGEPKRHDDAPKPKEDLAAKYKRQPKADPAPAKRDDQPTKKFSILDVAKVKFEEPEDDDSFNVEEWLIAVRKDICSSKYSIQVVLNTVKKVLEISFACKVFDGGKTISDLLIMHKIRKQIERIGFNTVLASLSSSAVQRLSTNVMPTYENFYGDTLEIMSDTVIRSTNPATRKSTFLNVEFAPYLQFSPKRIFDKVDSNIVPLMCGILAVVTSVGIRSTLVLEAYSEGRKRKATWVMDAALAKSLEACSFDLMSMCAAADRLYREGYDQIVGKYRSQKMDVITFIAVVTESHVTQAQEEEFTSLDNSVYELLATWRVVRAGTMLDSSWFKHPYMFLSCGDKVLPFINTYVKFVDAYIPWIDDLVAIGKVARERHTSNSALKPYIENSKIMKPKKLADKIIVLYGGVTLSRNFQHQAAVRFFTALWGEPALASGVHRDKTAIWEMFNFDLNPSLVSRTKGIDASDVTVVRDTYEAICREAYKVIVVTDLASESVNPTTNLIAAEVAQIFVGLPNVVLVTCKYCVVAPVTVECGTIGALTSTIQVPGMPVGRGHGTEGIFYVTPKTKKIPGGKLTLYPFATDAKRKGDIKLMNKYMQHMQRMSLLQFTPQPVLEIDSQYSCYFPSSFSNVGRRAKDVDTGEKFAAFFDKASLDLSE